MKTFSGANIQDLEHYGSPHLEHDKPDIAVIHIGSSNVSYNNLDIDASILAGNIDCIKMHRLLCGGSGNPFYFCKRKC